MTPAFPPYASLIERNWHHALNVLCVLVLVFLLLPILVIIPLSFSSGSLLLYPIPEFSLKWYQALLESEDWMRATRNSFIVAPAATLIATVLGTMAALGLHRTQFPGKGALMAVLISPMIVPLWWWASASIWSSGPYGSPAATTGSLLPHPGLVGPLVLRPFPAPC